MSNVVTLVEIDTDRELDALAARYQAANRAGLRLLNAVGGSAETLLDRLPKPVRDSLDGATERALWVALRAADKSRRAVPDQAAWVNAGVATALGAAGGLGGLPTALIELPATATMLLRSIQGAAKAEGFDPSEEGVQFDCVQVFAAAGPLDHDDGADLGFFAVRLGLTGIAMQSLISSVAPRLSVAIGQKLAARAVPVLGAVAGATSNYVYARYYQQVAHVQFGLRRLSADAGVPQEELVARLQEKLHVRLT